MRLVVNEHPLLRLVFLAAAGEDRTTLNVQTLDGDLHRYTLTREQLLWLNTETANRLLEKRSNTYVVKVTNCEHQASPHDRPGR